VVATKFFTNLYPGDPNGGGASRKSLLGACEQSLRRLQTDYIDLYWMHLWDKFTPIEETMRALDDLVRAGKVRYVGFSDTPAWKTAQAQSVAEFRGWTPLVALQIDTIIDELARIAREIGATSAAVALAWVQSRPGVASTIIGARRLDQLEQNLAALDVTLD
jgi:aryl-alcohol dehydrogenase-like predicted oxidoreductase